MPIDGPTSVGGARVDLGQRIVRSGTVAASPAAAAETIIASVTIPGGLPTSVGVLITGFAAFTVGASGTAVTLRIRQTDASGTIVKATGAVTFTAGNLGSICLAGTDTAPGSAGQVYVLTMTVTAGAASSTVSAVELQAIVV